MVSVFTIFFLSNDINNKTDISRSMQENVKHIMESITEDVRINEIKIDSTWVQCGNAFLWNTKTLSWNKLCAGSEYYLATNNGTSYIRELNLVKCSDKKNSCILMKNGQPFSNSWVEFENLEFTLFDGNPQKVMVKMTLRPSSKKWVKPELIQENTLHIQTTLSKRIY